MLDWVFGLIAKWTVGQKALAAVSGLHDKLVGWRTAIILTIEIVLFVLRKLGLLDGDLGEMAKTFCIALLGAIPITLADKAKKAQELADKIVVTR